MADHRHPGTGDGIDARKPGLGIHREIAEEMTNSGPAPLNPKERDKFLEEWQQPDLLFQHLTSMASHGAADHETLWARVGAMLVAALALLGGCAWLFSQMMGGIGIVRWVALLPLVGAFVFLVLCLFHLMAAASPIHQSEPHRLSSLCEAWKKSRERVEREGTAVEEHMANVERILILANWADVADDSVVANKERLRQAASATRHLVRSVGLLVAGMLLWAVLLSAQQLLAPDIGVSTMPEDEKETAVVHPPTEVTERTDPSRSEQSIVHPPTETVEKGDPPLRRK